MLAFFHHICVASIFFIRVFVLAKDDCDSGQLALDPRGNIVLNWKQSMHLEGGLDFAVRLSAKVPAFNWFAIGFSDRGDFTSADFCLLWVDWKGRVSFKDTWSDEKGVLYEDVKNDCLNLRVDTSQRHFSFSRQLDTCDRHDYIIDGGTTHIVWARGNDTLYRADGLDIKGAATQASMQRVQLWGRGGCSDGDSVDAHRLPVRTHNVRVPANDTTYWCHVHRLPDHVATQPHHIIAYSPSITPGNEGLVHHMEVFHCSSAKDYVIDPYVGSCFSPDRPPSTMVCAKVKAAWAMGASPFHYPKEAGLPLGGPDQNPYIMLEVHYNNQEMRSDWVDSSGIDLYVTRKLRKYDASIIELGVEYTNKMAIPPGQDRFSLTGYCVSECTKVGLPQKGISVFGSQLHTHLTGVEVITRLIRNGIEIRNLNRDKHYSTHFQEIRRLRNPVLVKPGDVLLTTCYFDTRNRENITIGGFAITDEMCVNYIHYYPASSLEVCKSSIATSSLESYFKFEQSWDGMTIYNGDIRRSYSNIKPWTAGRVELLKQLYEDAPLSMQCNKSNGDRFPGIWEDFPKPVFLPLKPENDHCKTRL